ncbi:MAG: ferritin family protein [Acidiphilium sp.]|nr:ferritin family protein [Acidiphilium sp.]MDD4936750.1 ferritin family protein [Acidiphilium sp.]
MRHLRILLAATAIAGTSIAAVPAFAEGSLNPQTVKNLETAMHGEAFAHLKYMAYAEHARTSGHPALAKLFDENANVEAYEHFAREADALTLAKADDANLLEAMAGEAYEKTRMYPGFAKQADAVGDKKVAAMFRQIAADEADHYASYKAALDTLRAAKK